jgi:hypothetical protein
VDALGFQAGRGSGTPARPRWVRQDPGVGLARPGMGGQARPTLGSAPGQARPMPSLAVSIAVSHSLSDLRWMIWVNIVSRSFDDSYQVFWSYFLKIK